MEMRISIISACNQSPSFGLNKFSTNNNSLSVDDDVYDNERPFLIGTLF